MREDEGEPLDAAGKERALAVAYRPARGPEEPVLRGAPARRGRGAAAAGAGVHGDSGEPRAAAAGGAGAAAPRQQGQEPAFQGPLPDLGLQPPPCRSPAAQQGFYLGGQIAQQQLLPYQVLPDEARRHGLRPLIRYCVGSVGRLTCSARRLRLLCSRSNLRLDGLLHAASRREPD